MAHWNKILKTCSSDYQFRDLCFFRGLFVPSSDLPTPFRVGWIELQTPTLPFLSLWPMANSRWSRGIPSRTSKIRKGIMKAPVMEKKKTRFPSAKCYNKVQMLDLGGGWRSKRLVSILVENFLWLLGNAFAGLPKQGTWLCMWFQVGIFILPEWQT